MPDKVSTEYITHRFETKLKRIASRTLTCPFPAYEALVYGKLSKSFDARSIKSHVEDHVKDFNR